MAIDDNASYELTGYQVKDLAGKVRAKADSSSLASVATSGLYSDLVGAPTIPTVYNGTLTIQQNGTQLGTFSANQSSNTTINITGGGSSINHLFYIPFSAPGNLGSVSVTFYKDSSLTTTATYEEVYDAIKDGSATVTAIYYDGGPGNVQEQVFFSISCGEYTDNTDEGYNAIEVFDSRSASTLTIYSYLADDQDTAGYPELPAVFSLIGTKELARTSDLPSNFTGATSSAAGVHGLVPGPVAGDQNKFLKGDGTWDTVNEAIRHLFYVSENLNLNQANYGFYIYKDSALTTAATYREVFDAAQDGGLTVLQINSSGFYMRFLESSGGHYTNYPESDDNYNYIFLKDGQNQMTLEPSSYDDPDYPDIAGTFNNSMPIRLAREEYKVCLRRKANVQGVYLFTNESLSHNFNLSELVEGVKGNAGYTLLSRVIVIYTLDQTNTSRNHQYRGGFFLNANSYSFAGMSPESGKFLYAVLVKRVGADFVNLLCRIEEPTPGSGEFTITEITFDQVMTGATSGAAGTSGLVPAPAAGDNTKFLAGDGTWKTAGGGASAATVFYYDDVTEDLYKDDLYTDQATFSDVTTAYNAGAVIIKDMTYESTYYSDGISVVAVDNIQSVFCMMQSSGTQYYVVYSYTPGGTPVWSHGVTELQNKLTAGTNVSILGNTISATDTTYSNFTGATSSVAGAAGLVPAPAAGDEAKALHGDGTWKDTTAKLVEMSYGEANAWTKFINAYNAGSIVYCRASSNANPASGSQTRKAFMAYVNNATTPTSVEFQYVRSVSSKTEAQPVDQVFVYTLTNTNGGTWSVASRNMGPKIAAGTGINVSYSNGTYTISLAS